MLPGLTLALGIRIYVRPYPPIEFVFLRPKRPHRRARLRKKWLKRYGSVYRAQRASYNPDEVIVIGQSVYLYPEAKDAFEKQLLAHFNSKPLMYGESPQPVARAPPE